MREGPVDGGNRSEQFGTAAWHYFSLGHSEEQTCEVFEANPGGVASRYISEGRLAKEVTRCFRKWEKAQIGRGKASKKKRAKVSVSSRAGHP